MYPPEGGDLAILAHFSVQAIRLWTTRDWYTEEVVDLIQGHMRTLYVKTGCPFCAKVLRKGEELGLQFELKNIADEGVSEELVARGGKRQVPYLVDDETGTEMYESDDICAYLEAHASA